MTTFIKEVTLFCFLIVVGLCVIYNLPRNPYNYMLEYDVKMKMVENPEYDSAIILLGGSATAFGYDSKMLQDSIGMPVINAGLHAGMGQLLIVDDIIPRLHKGDIVIYSPEYTSFNYGNNTINSLLTYSKMFDKSCMRLKHWYNVINNVPLQLKGNVSFLLKKIRGKDEFYIYDIRSFNKYGDVTAHWTMDNKCYHGEQAGDAATSIDTAYVNKIFAKLQKLNIYYYPASLAESSYSGLKSNIKDIDSILEINRVHPTFRVMRQSCRA